MNPGTAVYEWDRLDDTRPGTCEILARISIALLVFILAGTLLLHGQDQTAGPAAVETIATDRPAVTASSVVVFPQAAFNWRTAFSKLAAKSRALSTARELWCASA